MHGTDSATLIAMFSNKFCARRGWRETGAGSHQEVQLFENRWDCGSYSAWKGKGLGRINNNLPSLGLSTQMLELHKEEVCSRANSSKTRFFWAVSPSCWSEHSLTCIPFWAECPTTDPCLFYSKLWSVNLMAILWDPLSSLLPIHPSLSFIPCAQRTSGKVGMGTAEYFWVAIACAGRTGPPWRAPGAG